YLNISPNYAVENDEEIEKVIVPEVRNMTKDEASRVLAENKLGLVSSDTDGANIITDQSPLPGVEVDINTKIQLTTQDSENNSHESDNNIMVPNILGKTIQEAHRIINEVGLNIEIIGNGISVNQDPRPGEFVKPGGYIQVEF